MDDKKLLVGEDHPLVDALSKRERHQLVISLGEGEKGAKLRALFDRAASHVGKDVSVWSRQALMVAALELVLAGKIEE